MSILQDISKAIDGIKKTLNTFSHRGDDVIRDGREVEKRFFDRPGLASVARQARRSVLYFPVIASESLSSETMVVITKAVQVRAAEYVKIMVINLDTISGATGKDGVISALRGATLSDSLIEDVDALNSIVRSNLGRLVEHHFIEDGCRPPLEQFNEAKSQPQAHVAVVSEDDEDDEGKREKKLQDTEAKRVWNVRDIQAKAASDSPQSRVKAAEKIQELMADGDDVSLGELRKNGASTAIIAMLEKLPAGVIQNGTYDISGASNKVKVSDKIDFDKLNAFQPIMLELTLRYKTADGEPMPITDSLVVGVKGVTHPVPSIDLVTGLGSSHQRDSLVLQFFRMTSGEISFLSDFVLNLKQAKMRASSKTTGGTKVLETLRRQSEWNHRRSNMVISSVSRRGFVPPTATMVVTTDEIDRIKSLYGVDFSKPAICRDLLRSHNLMGFIIVDEAIGLVRMFEDGADDFDRIPMSTLKNNGKETSMKDLLTIMATR